MSSFCKSYSHFVSKKLHHICISLDVNFNESLTNDIVSFEQLGPGNKATNNINPNFVKQNKELGKISVPRGLAMKLPVPKNKL